jgi:hypothetical protein
VCVCLMHRLPYEHGRPKSWAQRLTVRRRHPIAIRLLDLPVSMIPDFASSGVPFQQNDWIRHERASAAHDAERT